MRFKSPQPVFESHDTTSIFNATTPGPACIQFPIPPPFNVGLEILIGDEPIHSQSEDCLALDIYVPKVEHKEDLPILVWIYGGGFLVGASWKYDAKPLVQRSIDISKPIIVVAINYRLGPFGFLNPSTDENMKNTGLRDQVEALRYLRRNARAFGGDPSRIMISTIPINGRIHCLSLTVS